MSMISSNSTRCAFHPEESIFNFCKSPSCFLPMCPICIKIHSQEHKAQKTHGDYESLVGVVGQIEYNIRALEKIIMVTGEQFAMHYESKKRCEVEIRKRILEARNRLTQHIERYLDEIETSLLKSITNYNQNIVEQFTKIDNEIIELQDKLQGTLSNLYGEKTLRTVITYYASDYLGQWKEQVSHLEGKIGELQSRNVNIQTDGAVIGDIMERLDDYLTLSYENYLETSFYAKQFSKTKSVISSRCDSNIKVI